LPAAQYVRMSTEHQQYSIDNQSAAIAIYAAAHKIGIVRSYVDAGKSGLTISRRGGLQELIRTVSNNRADFKVILVYDVSRWGRFQDVDEAAYYEFICKKAGIQVRYCAEQFENDNSPTSNLLKALKRMMAGEFSRELSAKVSRAQYRLASMGFWQGGPAPYAMRRQIVDKDGTRKQTLEWGQQKSVATDRVVLILGPAQEISDIRYMFDSFTKRKKRLSEIRDYLNSEGKKIRGKAWQTTTISGLLENPIFTGRFIFPAYRRARPKAFIPKHSIENPLVHTGAVPRLISDRQFELAQSLLRQQRARVPNKEQMLEDLRQLLRREGRICLRLIHDSPKMASATVYERRFGSITEAYRLIGYSPKGFSYTPIERRKQIRSAVLADFISGITSAGGTASLVPKRRDTFLINSQVLVSLKFSVPRIWRGSTRIWTLCIHTAKNVDIEIIVRLNPATNAGICDYFVVPRLADIRGVYHVESADMPAFIDAYRTTDLSELVAALGRSQIPEGS